MEFDILLIDLVPLPLLKPSAVLSYIGPGAGFVVASSFLAILLAFLSALAILITWPVRYLLRAIKGRKAYAKCRIKRMIILGLDGLEPSLAEKYMAEGKLPYLSELKDRGCYRKLGTVLPPLSPVAWSSFLTGCNPGKHNIFDFLTRDKRSYYPKLSSVEIAGPKRKIKLGKYHIPLGGGTRQLLRKGKPFWSILGDHGIFSNIIRVPITFPPEKFYGVSLSAMCVPDLRGTQGTFSYYTTGKEKLDIYEGGERIHVQRIDNIIAADLIGPENPVLEDKQALTCPYTVTLNGHPGHAVLKINGQKHTLNKSEYTEWVEVAFQAAPGMKIRGICQFLLLADDPEFELYVTPIHISPDNPAMPISHPGVYATYLSKKQGAYATLGLAEDSWALNEKVIDEKAFLHQCVQADEEREIMFFDALEKVKRGLCVCVFDGTDRLQHTFWRYLDSEHPANKAIADQHNEKVIEELYIRMDGIVGRTLERCDEETVLMVISDHGFNSFRYGVDLNCWLEENGYLFRRETGTGKKYLEEVDWSRTRAFALGLAGIFLNIEGRESQGIVSSGEEAERLREEIIEKLTGLNNASRDETAIIRVYNAPKTYAGPYKGEAPDLIVGYNKGYRVAWQTAVGDITGSVFHDNIKSWAGDHCIDPSLIPGVLFCNREITQQDPRLMDLAPTALELFGVDVPAHMDGKPLEVQELKNE